METIYRLKKRMVYPENLTLDQIKNPNKKSANPNDDNNDGIELFSWCKEPLESRSTSSKLIMVNPYINNKPTSTTTIESNDKKIDFACLDNSSSDNPHLFIQDRIRHLVDAFSTRAQVSRQCIDGTGTPLSSLSSSSVEDSDITLNPNSQLSVSFSIKNNDDENEEHYYDNDNDDEPEIKITATGCLGKFLHHIQIIDPNGRIYAIWMCVVMITVIYNAWVIPLRSTFPYQTAQNRAYWMFFDYLCDLIYLIDILLIQPRVKYLHEGFWVTDKKLLIKNYVKNKHFKLDILSLIPLDFFYIITGPDLVILRISRLFKIHTFWEFFGLIDRRLANPYTIRITKTFIYMMYLIHLNACAYYAFSIFEGIGTNNFVYNGQGNAYIKCFYFATKTATSIGKNPKPLQEFEYIFMTFSWLMGVFVFALLIGQIRDIISTATRSKTEYRKLVDETLEYMRHMNLPQNMQNRVKLWFSYTWDTQHTLDENTIMDCLPHKMKTDIAINVHINTLNKVKLFADCDEALLRELVLELKSVIYLPSDVICKKGDIGTEMYIIQSGKVQVIGGKNDKEVLATLSEGCVFGEISLLGISGMNRRTADVRSYGYSNLFVLDKTSLNQALAHYPEAQELLNKKAKNLMRKNAALERKNNAIIVIRNPESPEKHAKLLETVLQVLPPDSKSNKLLRYGSRQGPKRKPENDKFKYRNSLPSAITTYNKNLENLDNSSEEEEEENVEKI